MGQDLNTQVVQVQMCSLNHKTSNKFYHLGNMLLSFRQRCMLYAFVYMLRAIDRSALLIDHAVPSRDLLLVQATMDRTALSMDEHRPVLSGCTIDGSSRHR